MGFSRQEYWSGLPFPSPGIKPRSPTLQGDALTSEPPGKPPHAVGVTLIKTKSFQSFFCVTFGKLLVFCFEMMEMMTLPTL